MACFISFLFVLDKMLLQQFALQKYRFSQVSNLKLRVDLSLIVVLIACSLFKEFKATLIVKLNLSCCDSLLIFLVSYKYEHAFAYSIDQVEVFAHLLS